MKIHDLRLWLTLGSNLTVNDTKKIRGYLGQLFQDNLYAHQHGDNGRFVYQYPRVQYKVIDSSCLLIGFNEGVDIVVKVFNDVKKINLDGRYQRILEKELESNIALFSSTSRQITYTFLTPWLALNEDNFVLYQQLSTWKEKKELLRKILVGNILSMSKSLGYTVTQPVRVRIKRIKEVSTTFKGVPMIGFFGTFAVNFAIPDLWGIGKSVSRGFGTVKRLTPVECVRDEFCKDGEVIL